MSAIVPALLTARSGSKSVPNKNILKVQGIPLFLHNIRAAQECTKIDSVYMSSDIELAASLSQSEGFTYIDRPDALCRDDSSHHDTMKHGIDFIEQHTQKKIDAVVIMLGNARGVTGKDLDIAITKLLDSDADSILSVSKFNMFTPARAMKCNDEYLETIVSQESINNLLSTNLANDKDAYGAVYFFNGAFMICKRSTILDGAGLFPFPWMGKRILPYIQDVCMEIDAPWQVPIVTSWRP